MENLHKSFEQLGLHIPEILLPRDGTNMSEWAVIACDQFTSEPEYWKNIVNFVAEKPSTLNLILPEIYLEKNNLEERISTINNTMQNYLSNKILVSHGKCILYIERQNHSGSVRKGLLMAVDLEQYDYHKSSKSLIRATEETVIERLPPRMKIRQNASIECPHIMLLMDDPEKSVIEPLSSRKKYFRKMYDFELMKNGGYIKGFRINDKKTLFNIYQALSRLSEHDFFISKYGLSEKTDMLLFAVGDGNHSLAAAKAHWKYLKRTLTPEEVPNHPARYALVEIVNVHDDNLIFEPIYRIVFNISQELLLEGITKNFGVKYDIDIIFVNSKQEMFSKSKSIKNNTKMQSIPFISEGKPGILSVKNPSHNLEAGTLQEILDFLSQQEKSMKIDYIHGEDVLYNLSQKPEHTGFFLPQMNKHDLFKTVILEGVLPRKTFSIGTAEEKRYYLECRKIIKTTNK